MALNDIENQVLNPNLRGVQQAQDPPRQLDRAPQPEAQDLPVAEQVREPDVRLVGLYRTPNDQFNALEKRHRMFSKDVEKLKIKTSEISGNVVKTTHLNGGVVTLAAHLVYYYAKGVKESTNWNTNQELLIIPVVTLVFVIGYIWVLICRVMNKFSAIKKESVVVQAGFDGAVDDLNRFFTAFKAGEPLGEAQGNFAQGTGLSNEYIEQISTIKFNTIFDLQEEKRKLIKKTGFAIVRAIIGITAGGRLFSIYTQPKA